MAVVGVALIGPSNHDTRAAGELVCESRYYFDVSALPP